MSEQILVDGIFFKAPHENAPSFVKGKISIKVNELIEFLKTNKDSNSDYVNISMLESKKGTNYFVLDTWKPEKRENPEVPSNDYDKVSESTKEEESENIPF